MSEHFSFGLFALIVCVIGMVFAILGAGIAWAVAWWRDRRKWKDVPTGPRKALRRGE